MVDRVDRFITLLPKEAQTLDAGCGPGRDLERFVAAGHRPVGIDLNSDFVAIASEFAPVIEGDLRNLASCFRERSFDAVWASASLVHLDDAEALEVLQAFHRLLRDGGHLYACVMSKGQTGWLEESDGSRWYRAWPAHEFTALVESAGFAVDDEIDGPYVEIWATRLG
jgi:SAM-dependent methyltransferase